MNVTKLHFAIGLLFLLPPTSVVAEHSVGANIPFDTFEAEQAKTNGRVVRMEGLPKRNVALPEIEASCRSYLHLEGAGQYCEFVAKNNGNALTIRHSLPDAPSGGGITATLSLYINGRFAQKLKLDSKNNWLYGDVTSKDAGQSNDPLDGPARKFWNDSLIRLEKHPWRAGDTLRFQIDAGDSANHYHIDMVDLELAPPPKAAPANVQTISVKEFGATGNDRRDDTRAIERCLSAAKAKGATVWFPAGVYHHNKTFTVDGVRIAGAGMWHTKLVGTEEQYGFQLVGDGSAVTDLTLQSVFQTSRKDPGGKAFRSGKASHWSVENVCIRHGNCGFWLSGVTDGTLRHCRVYGTFADAINVNRSSARNTIEHNYIRGAGDDGIATLSELRDALPSVENKIQRNSVIANWWGHNINVSGGRGHVVKDNYLADNAHSACLAFNHPSAYPKHPLTDAVASGNTIVRGGGNHGGQRRGAIWTFAGTVPITGVRIQENRIVQPIFRGLHMHGKQRQEITFAANQIDSPGVDAIRIDPEVSGTLTLRDNQFRNLSPSQKKLDSEAGEQLQVVE